MMTPKSLPLRVLALEFAAILVTTGLTATVAPRLLLLGPEHDAALVSYCIATGSLQLLWVALTIGLLTFPLRNTLSGNHDGHSLRAPNPQLVIRLERLPTTLAVLAFAGATLAAALVWSGFSSVVHDSTPIDIGVAIFAINAQGAAQLLAYTAVRRVSSAVVEQLPIALLREANERVHEQRISWTSLAGRIALASFSSVAFVAVGAGLLLYAHDRASGLKLRHAAAADLALGVYAGASPTARASAEAAAAQRHWTTLAEPSAPASTAANTVGAGAAPLDAARADLARSMKKLVPATPDDRVVVRFERERCTIRFNDPRKLPLSTLARGALMLLLALTAVTGGLLGRAFERDLAVANAELRTLGASEVLRGVAVMHAAQFAVVDNLLRAIDGLGALFTQFAAAHARATYAKEKTERMRGLFLASMSHDLKGPLNAVLGFAELVRREPLSEGQLESCTIIAQRGRELLHLIETVLDAARIEANAFTLSPERAHLPTLLASVVGTAREMSAGSEVTIIDCIDMEGRACFVDSSRVRQAILSVILSAVRITRAAGVVQIETPPESDPDTFHVRVRSPAGALPQQELERIFEAFRYPDQARKHGSLGLGLSLARTICEMHGGGLEVMRADAGVAFELRVAVEQVPASLRARSLSPRALDAVHIPPLKPITGLS
jgi:signal transduction histidine kinase